MLELLSSQNARFKNKPNKNPRKRFQKKMYRIEAIRIAMHTTKSFIFSIVLGTLRGESNNLLYRFHF